MSWFRGAVNAVLPTFTLWLAIFVLIMWWLYG